MENVLTSLLSFNRTSVELKPCLIELSQCPILQSFNRTSVELKRSEMVVPASTSASFNRTSVELKRPHGPSRRPSGFPFNRTSVELKPAKIKKSLSCEQRPFNRTSVELKHFLNRGY